MSGKLIIDGNAVYEIDENCMLKKKIGNLVTKEEEEQEKKMRQEEILKILRENKKM